MVVFAVLPLYWMLVVSLKTRNSQLVSGTPWWPDNFTLEHYGGLLTDPNFGRLVLNTAAATGATLVISLVASTLAAFALAFYRLPRSRSIALSLFVSYLLPPGVLFLPIALMLSPLHLTNPLLPPLTPYPTPPIPFATSL